MSLSTNSLGGGHQRERERDEEGTGAGQIYNTGIAEFRTPDGGGFLSRVCKSELEAID